jgi:hypothetical protein
MSFEEFDWEDEKKVNKSRDGQKLDRQTDEL